MAVFNANRVTHVQPQGDGTAATQVERLGTVAYPDEPLRDKVVRLNPVAKMRRQHGKIVTSYVHKGHQMHHPGFAGKTSPIPGSGYKPSGNRRLGRAKRY